MKSLNAFFYASTLFLSMATQPLLALEDHAILAGDYQWIISNTARQNFPNVNLDAAKQHYAPRIEAKKINGRFIIDLTMPLTLSGGKNVVTRYVQVNTPPNSEMKFVNQARNDDYLFCSPGTDSWVDMFCGKTTLKQLQSVSSDERKTYIKERYGTSTDFAAGMQAAAFSLAGAEPGGQLTFIDPDGQGIKPWLGTWRVRYSTPQGMQVQATMSVDGYSGFYRPQGGHQIGVLSRLYYEDGFLRGRWEMAGSKGWMEFKATSNGFNGKWGYDEDDSSEPRGTWSGQR